MDHSYHPLDHHFQLPHVHQVDTGRPLQWLRMGWDDLRANPLASLTHGAHNGKARWPDEFDQLERLGLPSR